ncbi:MAG: Hsp70 family protein [Sulfobacillus thermosulfidooxidans]|uniref:Hsp70 family protein n=1 Tax=Sulfobacillus thermosulfidooxidans TaxID=28034 RepID=A0A2T2WTX2_SULTH|nr:MAG: Hsp70 family protein [Sulfobacillus thermosulfidooxidans]
MAKLFVGIDFGTTNSTIAWVTPCGIAARGPIPSMVAWQNQNVAALGQRARDLVGRGSPPYPLRDLKMQLGTPGIRMGAQLIDVVPLVSAYLRQLFEEIGIAPHDVDAVVGTPVRVSRAHRLDLRKAFKEIGLDQVRFVYEPTAALVGALHQNHLPMSENVLVVDWGGGTLDLALVAIDESRGFRELGVDGDVNDLGGSRMDQEIARRFLARSATVRQAVIDTPQGMDILLESIERLKVEFLDEGLDAEPRPVPGLPVRAFLEPDLVYEVADEFAERARMAIIRMIEGMNMEPNDVTSILFAGGVNQSEDIRSKIMTLFPEATIIFGDNPQLDTGIGCADLARKSFSIELAADFAVRQSDDSLCVLLHRGQPIELNAYRKAEFMVTDILADEALFDFGLCHVDPNRDTLWSVDTDQFRPLAQVFLQVGQAELSRGKRIADIVQVLIGLDENLSIAVFLRSQRSGASRYEFLTGVPLIIRIGDAHEQ